MQLGVHVVRFPWVGGREEIGAGLARLGYATESIGAVAISVVDHYLGSPMLGPVDLPVVEGYTTLGFLAGHTRYVRLRLLVSGVTYRHPGLLVKIVTTLDVLSGGRADLGLGAAWFEREHTALGVLFPPLSQRFERLEECLQIAKQMWGAENGPFIGRHYRLAETLCSPAPLSRPHPPIIVGGGGEARTLLLVAKYADACNLLAANPSVLAHKLAVLERHCDAVGRDFHTIRKTIVYGGDLLTTRKYDKFVTLTARCAGLGIEEVCVVPSGPRPEDWIRRHCGKVVQRLADLGPE